MRDPIDILVFYSLERNENDDFYQGEFSKSETGFRWKKCSVFFCITFSTKVNFHAPLVHNFLANVL